MLSPGKNVAHHCKRAHSVCWQNGHIGACLLASNYDILAVEWDGECRCIDVCPKDPSGTCTLGYHARSTRGSPHPPLLLPLPCTTLALMPDHCCPHASLLHVPSRRNPTEDSTTAMRSLRCTRGADPWHGRKWRHFQTGNNVSQQAMCWQGRASGTDTYLTPT